MYCVKTEYKILIFSVFLGLLVWLADVVMDYLYLGDGSFWEAWSYDTLPHEIIIRILLFVGILVFGIITSRLFAARRRAQESLAASRANLATTLHSIGDAVIATDLAGVVTFLNPVAQKFTGWSAEEAIGRPIHELFKIINEKTGEPVPNPVDRALNEKTIVALANRTLLIARDGSRRPIDDSAAPITDNDGKVTGAVLIFHDVTKSHRAATALRKEKETAQRYLNIAGVIIVTLDVQGRITMINRKGCEILGGAAAEIIGRNWFDNFIPERMRREVKVVFGKLMDGELALVEYYENLIITAAGEEHLIAWHNNLLKDEHGTISGTLSSGEDITERVEAVHALRESEERFRSIFTAAEDIIFIKNLELKYTVVNPSMEALLGMPASEQLGRTEEEVFGITGGGRDLLHEVDARVLAGETVEEEVTRPIKDKPITLHIIKMPIRDNSGTITGLCGIARNITHRKRAADALRENEVRLQRQNAALVKLDMRKVLVLGNLPAAVRKINETVVEALEVERVSVWLHNDDFTAIHCLDLYEKSKERHSDGVELAKDQYPAYFAALEESRTIVAHNAHTDPRTREFSDSYLTPLGITAMLDVPIRTGGRIAGVVCCEHVGPPRRWTLDEQNFAASMADSVALAMEVCEHSRAERELRASEERYRDLIERANDGVAVVQDSRLKFVNARLAEMIGYSVDEITGTLFIDYIYPDELEKVQQRYARRIAGEEVPAIYRTVLKHRDGRKIDVELNAGIINDDGAPADFVFIRDLTERVITDEVLKNQWSYAANLLDVMEDGVLVTSDNLIVEYANSALIDQFGPYEGKKCHEYLDGRNEACPWCKRLSVLSGKAAQFQWHSSKTGKVYNLIHAGMKKSDGSTSVIITLHDIMSHRQFERTVHQTGKVLEHIFNESLDIMMIVNEDGEVLKVSRAIGDILGFAPEDFEGQPISLLFASHAKQSPDDLLAKLRVYGGVFDGQEILRADGSVCLMDVTATVLPWRDGRAIFTTFREVTERKQIENKLQENEKQYRTIIENTFDLIISYLPDGTIIYASPQAKYYGYQPSEMIGRSLSEFIHPDDRERVMTNLRQTIHAVDEFLTESRIVGKDGTIYHVEEVGKIVRDGNKIIQITAVIRDISDRKRAEEIINQRDELIKNTIESLGHPFYVIDAEDYTIKLANSAAGMKISSEQSTCYALTHNRTTPCDTSEIHCPLEIVKRTGQPARVEHTHYDREGNLRIFEVHGYPIFGPQGKVSQIIEYSLDITDRKRAEEALKQSERRFQELFDSVMEGISLVDENEVVQYCNPAFAGIFEEDSPEQMVGKNLLTYIPEEERSRILHETEKLKEGIPSQYEMEIVTAKNKRKFVYVSITGRYNEEGRYIGAFGAVQDITDRKRTLEALRDNEEKYRTLYSSMNEGVALHEIIYDDDGAAIDYLFLDVNPAYEKILGLEQEQVIARKGTEVYQTDEAPFLDIYARVASSGDPVIFEEHIESLKKTFRISVFSPRRGRFATIFEDVTQHKQFEDQIKMLGRLPEENPSPVLRVDVDGVLIYANEQSRQLLLDWNTEVGNPIPDQWWRMAGEALKSNEQNEIEFECGAATYLMFIKPVAEAGYVNMYALDITDHRRTEKALLESEEQLLHAQKMEAIGRLAGSVAHDFNNLISVITGHTELLLHRLDPDSPLGHNVREIKETANRASSLTRQLLAFSRKQVLAPKVLNINDIVDNVQTMLQRLIGENIELVTATDAALKPVKADPGQMEQVLMNLVINARDALPDGGRITIATANTVFDEKNARELGINAGPYIRLTVSDTGTGMDEDTMAHIFEPFFTTKEAGKGTGLGLSTVYGIITQSGGHIKVESEPGDGTTFIIHLSQVDISAETTTAEPSCRREEIILVVEDEEGVRDMVCKTLRSMGHEIITAHDGADALEKYEQHTGSIHLLLTDVVMPHMSGIDLAETLIAQHPGLKVIFMSGYTSSDVVKESPAGKGSSFLEKPFTLDHLCHTVRTALDQPTPQLQQTP